MEHRRDLDGIRALAVLAVLASHTEAKIFSGGWMGVDMFFVLSGFLITTLLLVEHDRTGSVALGKFYGRRALRLYPALLLVLIVGVFFYKTLGDRGTLAGYGETASISAFYLQDFFYGFGHQSFGNMGHTWSLAVEEQFYLCWPPLMYWLMRHRRDPLKWAIVGTLLSWAIVVFYDSVRHDQFGGYFLPWCRFSQLLIGCALAILIHRGRRAPSVLRSAAGGIVIALLVLGTFVLGAEFDRYPGLEWQGPAIAIATTLLVWHLNEPGSPLRRLLGSRPLFWLGRRSYGVYLIHLPVLYVLDRHVHASRTTVAGLMVLIAIVLAGLSYRFVELPFLRLKKRFQVVPS